ADRARGVSSFAAGGDEPNPSAPSAEHCQLSRRKIPHVAPEAGSADLRVSRQRGEPPVKRFLRWLAAIVIACGVLGFIAFLYFIPPFNFIAPEAMSRPAAEAGPDLRVIADAGE